jgi:NADH-quinone oxidoreductase subunit F
MTAEPTVTERTTVDALLGESRSISAADRAIEGGFHETARRRHLLLPVLHAVQDAIGWISPGAVSYVSRRLLVPPADVYGVASFYHLFTTEEQPPGVTLVCDDVPCRLAGAEAMMADLDDANVQRSPCLGRCDQAQAALVRVAGEPSREVGRVTSTPPVASPSTRLLAVREPMRSLRRALDIGPDALLDELEASGLRGRGGAAFPAGVKWRAVAAASGEKYVVANADESEPGTFKDRVLLERDPGALIEAMAIAGYATGASLGFIYLRGEYPRAAELLTDAIANVRAAGHLGNGFDVELRCGAGAYICGEETALFNSIEGHRGEPRQKPPFPTEAGLFGRPTVVNNVETLYAVLDVLATGGAEYARLGTAESTGTKLFCLSGHVSRPGVYEVEFGATVNDLVDLAGGPMGETRAVLLGGAAGAFVGPELWDMPLTFEATRDAGLSIGSGAVIVCNASTDFGDVVRRIAAFFRDESCGQCVPCRIGTVRQEEALVRLHLGAPMGSVADERARLAEIDRAMKDASICGLGHTAGTAVQSAVALGLIGGEA